MCYMDTGSFIVYIIRDYIFKDIAEVVETRFDTSNYELECKYIEWTLPIEKNEKVIVLMNNELVGQKMTKLAGLRTNL